MNHKNRGYPPFSKTHPARHGSRDQGAMDAVVLRPAVIGRQPKEAGALHAVLFGNTRPSPGNDGDGLKNTDGP